MTAVLNAPLRLPRRTAIALLHAAQTAAPEGVRGLLLGAPGAQVFRPVAGDRAVLRTVLADAAAPWAVFEYRADAPLVPAPEQFAAAPALLHLTATLEIRGVLQLHAWRLVDAQVQECALCVDDD